MPEAPNALPVDLSYLEEYSDGDPESMKELIDAFYTTFQEGIEELRALVSDGESLPWSQSAHKLKGAAGYVGAEALRTLCAQAQDMKVASFEERNVLFQKIETHYRHVKEFLEKEIP